MEKSETPLGLAAGWFRKRFSRFDRTVFLLAFLLSVGVHLYAFTRKLINHDDVGGLYSDCSFGLASGRFLLHFVTGINGYFSSSWINGLTGSLFFAVAAVFIVKVLELGHYATAVPVLLTLAAFPTLASTYAYMFCSYQYIAALALVSAGVWLIRKDRLPALAGGVVLIALAMGCYQAYFCFACALLVLLLMLDLARDRWNGSFRGGLLTGLRTLGALAAAMALYLVILKVCLAVTGTELTEYQGINQMGQLTFETLLKRLYFSYYLFFPYYRETEAFPLHLSWMAFPAFAAFLGYLVWSVARRRLYRSVPSVIALCGLLAVFPLACNLTYMMTDRYLVHSTMQYALVVPLLLPAVVAERMELPEKPLPALRRGMAALAVLLVLLQGCLGGEFFLLTNRAYFSMEMTTERTLAYYSRLTTRIESQEGYVHESPLALVGEAHPDYDPKNYWPYTEIRLAGVLTEEEALNIYTRGQLMTYYLGRNYHYVPEEDIDAIWHKPEVLAMPCYPADGSLRWVDGVLVVKFSDPPEEAGETD